MEHAYPSAPQVGRAAQRLARPHARLALGAKRAFDVVVAAAMLAALAPVAALIGVLLLPDDDGWLERRVRVGRDGRPLRLARFRPLPGRLGQALERLGARELPLLVAVLGGRLSFVGPRALPPGAELDDGAPRRLLAPGLIGPAQSYEAESERGAELEDAYVEEWSLLGDLRLLAGGRRRASGLRV
jgi:lipopolysaccharide/colanic/teichoic acid biosynthesis glycosyltransferase